MSPPGAGPAVGPSETAHAHVLLPLDRLGFRLLVFGGLALLWIVQGRLSGQPWSDLIRGELGGLLPWAFLAPIVLSIGRRVRIDRVGAWRFLAAHLAGHGSWSSFPTGSCCVGSL